MQKPGYFKRAAVFLALFGGLTLLLALNPQQKIDLVITTFIQNLVPKSWDNAMAVFSILGNTEIIIIPFLTVVSLFKGNKNKLLIFSGFVLGSLVEIFGKSWFNHPGPPEMFYRNNLHIVLPTLKLNFNFSYPSGHSFRIVYLIMMLGFYWHVIKRKKSGWRLVGLWAVLIIMMISRISLGEHWPSDVLGGVLLGGGLGYLCLGLAGIPGKNKVNIA